MSNKPIIEIKDISKKYQISHRLQNNAHKTIKEDIAHLIRKPLELIGASGGVEKEEFWALNKLNLEVMKGEVVGIMGRNGSGKSTLLKILSRITQPTTGEILLHDKTTSLLEVGTGFHPELTGRENIYFNGSILGMRKTDIEKNFSKIVEFSEVENFLDTPIKFYSSGMKVRLAFSIAAHLEPEILIIDEVMAVGDVKFKEKSIKRMKEIADSGKTILFVSHIVSQIERICTRGVVLHDGNLVFDGPVNDSIEKYFALNSLSEEESKDSRSEDAKPGKKNADTGELSYALSELKLDTTGLFSGVSTNITLVNNTTKKFDSLWVGLAISDKYQNKISLINNDFSSKTISLEAKEKLKINIQINNLNIIPGEYSLTLSVRENDKPGAPMIRQNDVAKLIVPPYVLNGHKYSAAKQGTVPPVVFESHFTVEK